MIRRKSVKRIKSKPCVYFIQDGDDGLIKIGMTKTTVHERHMNLQMAHASPLYIRGIIRDESPRDLESTIHALFQSHRRHGEWFAPSKEILDFIKDRAEPVKQASVTIRVETQKLCVECGQKTAITQDGNLCGGCLRRWVNKQNPGSLVRRKPDESSGPWTLEQDPSFEDAIKRLENPLIEEV